jgi:hypothetical protein
MGSKISIGERERLRRDYWLLREKYPNKDIAAKLGVDEGNLSALANGTINKEGKPKNPGKKFIKHFYMTYPELKESPEDQPADSNPNKESKEYQHGGPSPTVEEAQLHYMNGDDPVRMRNELLSQYKKNDEFLRTEFSKMTNISQTAVNAFDKMAESTLLLSQKVISNRKKTNPASGNSSRQP